MPKTYYISAEQGLEIEAQKKVTKNVVAYRRLEALALRASGKKNHEIAAITGCSADRVNHLVSEYCLDPNTRRQPVRRCRTPQKN